MCGVWGFVKEKATVLNINEYKFIHDAALAGQVRGEDGFGIIVVYENGVCRTFKGIGTPNSLMESNQFEELFGKREKKHDPLKEYKIKAVFGHNRAATKGQISPGNSHPFRHKHITLMHNGTLNNHLPKEFDVDSLWATHRMAEDSPEDVFNSLFGAYVFIWHNNKDKTINLVSNGQRPLHYQKTTLNTYFASEAGMLEWLLTRIMKPVSRVTATSVKTDVIYCFDCLSDNMEEIVVKKNYRATSSTNRSIHSGGGSSVHTHSRSHVENNNSGAKPTRQLFFYKRPFPSTVAFKLNDAPYNAKSPSGESVCIATAINTDKREHANVIVVSKMELDLKQGIEYIGECAGWVRRYSTDYLIIKPHTVIDVDEVEEVSSSNVLANGETITEEDYSKKKQCFSCLVRIEKHELNDTWPTRDGLLCPDCSDTFIKQQNSLDSSNNVHRILQ